MKKKLNLCLIVFSLLIGKTFAQLPSLGFNTPPVFPFTVALDDSFPTIVPMAIKNYSTTTAFNTTTPIYLMTQVKVNGAIYSIDSSNFISQAFLNPLDTVVYNYVEPYNSARFVVGIDVVVIWPKALNATVHDSIEYTIHITPPASVARLLADDGILVYPIPCSNTLNIKNSKPINKIEQVRIFDTKGNLILQKSHEEVIDLNQIPNALYVVEIIYKSGMHRVIRVQKQE